jgi:hypothetical protein
MMRERKIPRAIVFDRFPPERAPSLPAAPGVSIVSIVSIAPGASG